MFLALVYTESKAWLVDSISGAKVMFTEIKFDFATVKRLLYYSELNCWFLTNSQVIREI